MRLKANVPLSRSNTQRRIMQAEERGVVRFQGKPRGSFKILGCYIQEKSVGSNRTMSW